ncbi:MAG: ABC transporter substrate-binding protein, partial [Chloroflexota bacterium]
GHKNFNGVDMVRSNFSFTRALYNSLVRLDPELNPQPELAEKWSFSADGKTMTLNLRQGVKFHTGRDFTSDDVKFTWEYSKDPVTGSPQMRTLFSLITDVKAPDKYTAQLTFDKPQAVVFDILDVMCVVDRTAVEKIATTDAGSGPFKVTKYVPNDEVVMQRFSDYWEKGKPYLDEYVLKTIPDAGALVLNLESKALDAIWAPPLQEVARLKSVAGLASHPGGGAQGMFFVGANVRGSGPLTNKKVRQAINFAIDRPRCARTALSDTVESTCLMVPRNSWAYFADLENKYAYNLDKAKQLLTEAGFANGFDIGLMVSSKDNPPQLGIAQVLQADLAKINIRAKIEDVEATIGNTRTNKGEFELLVWQYGRANRDPGTMMSGSIFWTPGPQGAIGFESADYLKWRDQGQTTLEREQRKPLYRNIQEYVLEESFLMPVAGNASFFILDNRLQGLVTNRESSPFVGDMWWNK